MGIEKTLPDKRDCRSWESVRETLRTHQVVTVVLPTATGEMNRVRPGHHPRDRPKEIYDLLSIDHEIMKPVRSWTCPKPQ